MLLSREVQVEVVRTVLLLLVLLLEAMVLERAVRVVTAAIVIVAMFGCDDVVV